MANRKSRGQSPAIRNYLVVLGVLVIAGLATLGYLVSRPAQDTVAMVDPVTLPEAEGYLMGSPDAPVQIIEFADFECPACAHFSVLTEPDVRARIVEPGLASFRFMDFPLPQHRNTWDASHAAACAAEQGQFWPMHDLIFRGQTEWSGVRRPKGRFEQYARQLNLDMRQWNECYDSRRYQDRIAANKALGERLGVSATPTFIIGSRMVPSAASYDRIKALVDSAAAAARSGAAEGGGAEADALQQLRTRGLR